MKFQKYGFDFQEEHEVVACIRRLQEEDESVWQVSCFDGECILRIGTTNPHHFNHPDYQAAYDALFRKYPTAALVGTDRWYVLFSRAYKAS